jgi:4-carboxymuconolactone decarboxylase
MDEKSEFRGGAVGLETLKKIGGDSWDAGIAPLAAVSPDMARLTVDFAYGDVLSRPGLDLLTRQCCTVAMLLTNGSASAQLKFHLNGLLNVGGTIGDAAELLTIGAALAGFPAAIGSVSVLRDVLSERGLHYQPASDGVMPDRWARGLSAMREMIGCSSEAYTESFRALAPEFAELSLRFEFGDVLSRSGLSVEIRQLVAIAMLAAAGNRTDLLRMHMVGALARGLTVEHIGEVLIQLSVYAGFPAALSAFGVLADAKSATPQDHSSSPMAICGEPADRRSLGLATLQATSKDSGDAVVHSFDDIAPDIGALIVDHAYAEIFSNHLLDPKVRELAAIATIASRMTEVGTNPLGVHIAAALELGASRDEIVQTIVNVAPYSGYPTAQRALAVAANKLAG